MQGQEWLIYTVTTDGSPIVSIDHICSITTKFLLLQ